MTIPVEDVETVLVEAVPLEPELTRLKPLSCHVCVPEDYTDEQVVEFAKSAELKGLEEENPNWSHGSTEWRIRREGDESLRGDPERNPCAEKPGFVHVMLDV